MIAACMRDRRAATMVEFAFTMPVIAMLLLLLPATGFALWTHGVLQEVCEETARCGAIGGSSCATATAGCDSGEAIICYAEQIASQRGVPSITASEVAATSCSYGGAAFICVTITHPFNMVFYSVTLTSSGAFPTSS